MRQIVRYCHLEELTQGDARNCRNPGRPSPKVILNDGPELLFTGNP